MRKIDIAGTEVELELDDDEIILDAIVLIRVTKFDSERGTSSIISAASDNTDYITSVGMLRVALEDNTQ